VVAVDIFRSPFPRVSLAQNEPKHPTLALK